MKLPLQRGLGDTPWSDWGIDASGSGREGSRDKD